MSLTTLAIVGAVLALLYVLPLIIAVIAVRSAPVAIPRFAEVDQAWLDAAWMEEARPTLDKLAALGFVHRTFLDGMAARTDPTGLRCAAVLVNEETGDIAQVAVVERFDDRMNIELISFTMLSFTLGPKRVATMNGDMPGVFDYPKTFVGNALPMLHNVETLVRAHRALVARHTHNAKRGEVVARGNEVKWITRQAMDDLGYQVRRGLLQATADGGFRQTWSGAIRGVWRLHPRFIGMQRRRIYEKGLRTLVELGITPDPVVERAPREQPTDAPLSPEMEAFVENACAEYTAAAERLETEWQLTRSTSVAADMTTGVATFNFPDGRIVVADFQVIGTWARKSSWEWAWNNPNVADAVKPNSQRLREFGETNGIGYMASGFAVAPSQEIAAYFAAMGAKVLGGGPVIPLPPDLSADVVVMALLVNLRSVQPNAA